MWCSPCFLCRHACPYVCPCFLCRHECPHVCPPRASARGFNAVGVFKHVCCVSVSVRAPCSSYSRPCVCTCSVLVRDALCVCGLLYVLSVYLHCGVSHVFVLLVTGVYLPLLSPSLLVTGVSRRSFPSVPWGNECLVLLCASCFSVLFLSRLAVSLCYGCIPSSVVSFFVGDRCLPSLFPFCNFGKEFLVLLCTSRVSVLSLCLTAWRCKSVIMYCRGISAVTRPVTA